MRTRHSLIAALLVATIALPSLAEDWPHWRGPNYDGVSNETNLPTEWSATKNMRWSVDIPGDSGSTPIIWKDRIYLTSMDGKDLLLMCLNTSGEAMWKKTVGTGKSGRGEGNDASPTPSTDGQHIWSFFGTGELFCHTMEGKEVWKTNIQERYGKFRFGFGMHMTPALHGDHLYLQLVHSGTQRVIALDKSNGKEVWNVERKSDGKAECEHSYASPVIWQNGNTNDNKAYLLTHGNDYAIGHNLKDGSERWRLGDLNPKTRYNRTLRFVASPVASKNLIVIPSAKNGPIVGISPDATGFIDKKKTTHQQWRRKDNTPDVPSPVIHDGLVYLCRENGILLCLDATTGKEIYYERTRNYKHRASPIYADGKVYLTAADGTVSVVKAGREFKLLAQNKLKDTLLASPVVSDGTIYLRGNEKLYAISLKK